MTMHLLITGGAGFIGSAFTRLAVANGATVTVLDKLTYAGRRENLEGVDCELIVGDICDATLVAETFRTRNITHVAHLAAESHVDNSITGPDAFLHTNIHGTFTLLQAARVQNVQRFLNVSTDEVYGSLSFTDAPFTETSPYAPNSPYSASKAAADHLARAWHETYGLPVITTHCSNNYGPRQHGEKLIPRMIACALAGEKLPVYGQGANVRDWIHVEDHSHGLWLALTKGTPGRIYNFGGRAERGNLALVQTLCARLDTLHPCKDGTPHADAITFVTDRLGHDLRYAIDDTRAEQELGFTRQYDFEQGLSETVKWYLENMQ